MNNIVANFDQILEFAKDYGLPLTKKRAILREYLQVKTLDLIYQEKTSLNLFFVGGTSLRLICGLDRFSEDLDFDVVKISPSEIKKLMNSVYQNLLKENIEVSFYQNVTAKRAYYEFRFKNLLYQLNLSSNKEEKLMVKFDFERFWQGQKRQIILLKRYGYLVNVVTMLLDQLLVQKLFAYTQRRQTLPRDLYDIIWLTARGAKIDYGFVKKNKLPKDLVNQAKEKFVREKSKIGIFKRKLRPFLINENYIERLNFFPKMLEGLS